MQPDPRSVPREAWSELHQLLDDERDELERLLFERATTIPAFAELVATARTARGVERSQRSRELTRKAMLEGDWEPFVANLQEQGREYARGGIRLGNWYPLLEPMRTVAVPAAIRRFAGDPDRLARVLLALHAYLDLAMHEIGQAHVLEQAAMAEAARGQRDLFHTLFLHCPLGLAIHSRQDGAFAPMTVNSAAAALSSGFDEADPALHEARADFQELLGRCVETAQSFERTYAIGGRTIQVWFVPLGGGHVGTVHDDLTTIRKANRALRQSVRDLERSNRDLDQFAYVASHDLKAPLRDIDNLSQWLEQDLGGDLAPEPARHLERLRDRVRRMERLLDDLLQYSRAGRHAGAPERVDLRDALAASVALLSVPPGFQVRGDPTPLALLTVPAPLELVLRNLVGNAIKHHDRPESGSVQVSWRASGGWAEVDVTDDGPGVPPEYHERIFELFQTLKPRDRVEGSGMGLAIVRKVVESAGGTVRVASGMGRGLTLSFTWPLAPRTTEEEDR